MKYARYTILFGILVSTLIAAWVLAVPQAEWKVVLPKTNVGEKWRMAAFNDGSFGFTGGAGDVGKARYTSDGAKTWATADSSGG
ncbi:MAG: hypothetical protein JXA73_09265 [Acidobacteria bacterium]|nr:hypothetical protein [Acidobacteriota bacterium]